MTGRPRSIPATNPELDVKLKPLAGWHLYGEVACAVGRYAHDRRRLHLPGQEGLKHRSALERDAPAPLRGDRVARRYVRILVFDRVAGVCASRGRASVSGAPRSTALRAGLGEPARRTRERRCLARHRRIKYERDAARRGLARWRRRHRLDANALRRRLDATRRAYRRVSRLSRRAGTNSQARGGLDRIARCRGVHRLFGMGRPRCGDRRRAVRRYPSARRHLAFTSCRRLARRAFAARHIARSNTARWQPASGGGRASGDAAILGARPLERGNVARDGCREYVVLVRQRSGVARNVVRSTFAAQNSTLRDDDCRRERQPASTGTVPCRRRRAKPRSDASHSASGPQRVDRGKPRCLRARGRRHHRYTAARTAHRATLAAPVPDRSERDTGTGTRRVRRRRYRVRSLPCSRDISCRQKTLPRNDRFDRVAHPFRWRQLGCAATGYRAAPTLQVSTLRRSPMRRHP